MRNKLLKLGVGALAFAPFPASAASQQCQGAQAVTSSTDACNPDKLATKIGDVVNALFIVVGSIAVIILIIGGIRYITSTGDATRIKSAKDTLLYAVIGLIVVILARAIVGFVIGQIG